MKAYKITAYLLLLVTFFVSCKKEEAREPDYNHWPVVQVDGLQQASVGQNILLTVSWPYSSGCDVVEKFLTKKEALVYDIKALGYTMDAICTQDAGLKTLEYAFRADVAGTYSLNFENPDGTVITHSILVQ